MASLLGNCWLAQAIADTCIAPAFDPDTGGIATDAAATWLPSWSLFGARQGYGLTGAAKTHEFEARGDFFRRHLTAP